MSKISEFNEEDWEEIHKYLQQWNESKLGGKSDWPDSCGNKALCCIIPLAIASIKNAKETEKLNVRLFWLTVVIAILTGATLYTTILY